MCVCESAVVPACVILFSSVWLCVCIRACLLACHCTGARHMFLDRVCIRLLLYFHSARRRMAQQRPPQTARAGQRGQGSSGMCWSRASQLHLPVRACAPIYLHHCTRQHYASHRVGRMCCVLCLHVAVSFASEPVALATT